LICVIPFNGGRDSRHSSPTSLAIPGVSTHIWMSNLSPIFYNK
jgi:hypothetical protein